MTWKPSVAISLRYPPLLNPTLPAADENYKCRAGVIARSTAVDKSAEVAIANQRLYINSPVEHNISCQALEPVRRTIAAHQVTSVEDIRVDFYLIRKLSKKRILPPLRVQSRLGRKLLTGNATSYRLPCHR